MVLRSVIVIALATCLFVLNCDACDTEKCSTKVATDSSDRHLSTAATSKSKVKPPKKKKGMKCAKHEEFSICTQSISRAQYCSQKGQSLCSHDNDKCTKGCVCKENYLRSNNGTCIPERQCDTDCGQNEVLEECPADCADDYCPTKDGEVGACFKPNQDQCPPPVCKCKFNYRRTTNGTCISTRDCPPFDCSARPNEEFHACPPLCPTDDCSQATPSGNCPPQFGNILITLPCSPKCRCIKGYWRKDGICVPYEECPNICPLNEEYNSCTQAICRHQNCSTRHEAVRCPRIDPAFCKRGCICKENYYRNKNGTCVPEEQCNDEPKPTCEDSEILVDCPAHCESDHCPKCEEDNKRCEQPNPCPPPACKCRFNYRRAVNGTCIPTVDCPPFDCSAKPNEKYTPCPPICPSDSCGLPRIRGKCPFRIGIVLECNPKCQCKDGFGRLKNGTCVPFDECPDICPLNEEYNSCTQATCRHQNCSTRNDPLSCPRIDPAFCKRGCVCKENYYRNKNGTCVPEEQCNDEPKPTCKDNEVLVDCPSHCESDHCPKCEEDNKRCEQPKPCPPPSCKCRFNYRRAVNGTCIPTVDCPPFDCSAKPNEKYTPCPPICPSDSCGLPRIRGKCPFRIGIVLECNPKCQCKDGFGRLKNGTCVPFDECPDICPLNEEYNSCTQATCRHQNCSTRNDPLSCPRIDPAFCKKGCICKENYYRNKNGTCVPEEQCNDEPKPTCKDNEVLVDCPSHCESDHCPKCEEDNKRCEQPKPCPPPACKCRFNYRRAVNGTCIPTVDCPPFDCSAKPNEKYTPCPPICPSDSCGLPRIRGKCPFRIGIILECNPKCQCKDGFGRLDNGTCVPFDECPDICPLNEEYNSCTQATCRHQNCSTRNDPLGCPRIDSAFCKRGCVCKENYYRNKNGTCVPEEQCNDEPKPTCKDNEVLVDCPSHCESDHCPKCEEDNKRCEQPNPCPPPACKCRFNYRRAVNGTCIPTVDCPPFDCSAKPNEKYTPCPPICPSDSCGLPRIRGKCPFRIGIVLECNPKCQCKDGFGRLKNGTCMPFDECPDICPLNEEYNSCTQAKCRHQNCSTRNDPVSCPRIDPAFCQRGCVCKENYYRNKNGTCVPEEQCNADICPLNEEYNSCTQATCRHQNCSTRNDSLSCPRIDPAFCKKGCVCKENYYRNKNGTCVPEEQCNDDLKRTCEDNEILVDCPSHCESDHCPKCEEDNKRCEQPNPCPPPACKCRFNYRRAVNGTCIPTVDCPPFDCSAKPNEKYTPCPPICPSDSCGLPRIRGKCPFRIGIVLECNPKCQCKDGFGRLKNGTCVPFDECPDICPLNEEYNSCTQATCRHQNCSTRNDPLSCPSIDPAFCKKGCVCKENYYRNKNGTCVPEEQCNDDLKPTCKDNEILVDCPSHCESDHCPKCEEDNKRCEQPNPCPPPACKCRFNYRRDENGTCIPTVDCPPFDCSAKPNEKYTPCPPICPSDSCGLPRIRGKCPFRIGIVLECNPKCQCKDGFGRLENGTCVPFDECPNLCPTNEEYNSCRKDCVCKENYYRNDDGVCVEDEKCPDPLCPNPNEEYKKSLVSNCPLLGTCTSIVVRFKCDKPEVASCICKSGYLRLNETSHCIPTCECPQMKNALECQTDCS